MSYQSENSESKPKIVFVKDMHYSAYALCLWWIDEIHIEESLKNSPILQDLINHELKHYQIIKKSIALHKQGKFLKALALAMYNNIWDLLDSLRIELKWMVLKCKSKIK